MKQRLFPTPGATLCSLPMPMLHLNHTLATPHRMHLAGHPAISSCPQLPPCPPCIPMRWSAYKEGALDTAPSRRVRCKFWVYLGTLLVIIATIKRPPGKKENYPEAFGNYWQPYEKLRRQWCACNSAFLVFNGLFGWVHLGMVHRSLTTNSCHGADMVRARCNNSHKQPHQKQRSP